MRWIWPAGKSCADFVGERGDARREFVLIDQDGGALSSSRDRVTWATDDAEGTSNE